MNMNVYALGASRNIGYFASIRLLEKEATVTFLLRSPSVFDDDAVIQKYVKAGKVRLVKGDALQEDDVRRGWATASESGAVDVVLFTVGGLPHFSLKKGIVLHPPNLVTHAFQNVLCTLPQEQRAPDAQPRVIAISSNGLTRSSHSAVPLLIKPLYGALLHHPHADKLGVERLVAHAAGWPWVEKEPDADILAAEWRSAPGLPAEGGLKRVLVVRPALYIGEECKADSAGATPPYRVADHELSGAYTISRRDVAHFLVEGALTNWEEWEGKCATIAY